VKPRVEITGSHRPPGPFDTVLHRSHPDDHVEMSVVLRRPSAAPDPTVRLSHEAFEARHGADIVDWDHAYSLLTDHGLDVLHFSAVSRTFRLSGPVHVVERTFHIELHEHATPAGETYRAHPAPLTIPGNSTGLSRRCWG